jgi:hypothetical protein
MDLEPRHSLPGSGFLKVENSAAGGRARQQVLRSLENEPPGQVREA